MDDLCQKVMLAAGELPGLQYELLEAHAELRQLSERMDVKQRVLQELALVDAALAMLAAMLNYQRWYRLHREREREQAA
jgi:hypothetical protein